MERVCVRVCVGVVCVNIEEIEGDDIRKGGGGLAFSLKTPLNIVCD